MQSWKSLYASHLKCSVFDCHKCLLYKALWSSCPRGLPFPATSWIARRLAPYARAESPRRGHLRQARGHARRVIAKVEWHRGELFPRVGFIVTNLSWRSKRVVRFYNGRGTAEQWIKEGKNAVKWTKLSCRTFKDNQTRLQLFALAYNLANFLRRLAVPKSVSHWTLTTLREKLIKIGAKVTRHSKYVTFQLAEVAVPRELFAAILERIARLAMPPPSVGRAYA